MSYLPFAISAYLLNSLAVLIDKFLLVKTFKNPLIYIFYISLFSLLALIFIPFTPLPSFKSLILASISTLFWTTGAYFLYSALKFGQPSRVVPVIGALIPIFLLIYFGFLNQALSFEQIIGVIILILGLIFLVLPNLKGKLDFQEISLEVISALFFTVSYIVLKQAYQQAPFLTVLAYSRLILLPILASFLVIPNLRRMVLTSQDQKINFYSKTGLLFLTGQFFGGISEILITFSISLANPALVNSLQGTQYVFLFLFSIILARQYPQVFKETWSILLILGKVVGISLIVIGLYLL